MISICGLLVHKHLGELLQLLVTCVRFLFAIAALCFVICSLSFLKKTNKKKLN